MRTEGTDYKRRSATALALIAVVAIGTHATLNFAMKATDTDAELINNSGRQRMLSQRIALFVHLIHSSSTPREDLDKELESCLVDFIRQHEVLRARPTNSPTVRRLFEKMQPAYETMVDVSWRHGHEVAGEMSEEEKALEDEEITSAASEFLRSMTSVVTQYELEAAQHLSNLGITLMGLLGATLLAAFGIHRLILRPVGAALEQRITELTRSEAEKAAALEDLEATQARFDLAVAGSRDALWDWNKLTNEIYYAPKWCELLGLAEEDLLPTPDTWFTRVSALDLPRLKREFDDHIAGVSDSINTQFDMVDVNGDVKTMLCRGGSIRDANGVIVRIAGSVADVTELRSTQRKLSDMAYYDQLTKLPNRQLFLERLTEVMRKYRRGFVKGYAVLFLDFDDFKLINDSLGHDAGDTLLNGIARRLRREIRELDTAARFGGDEFVILLGNVKEPYEAEAVCARLIKSCALPHKIDGRDVRSSVSIGLVHGSYEYESPKEILRDADAAMYRAKLQGRARYCVFDSDMHVEAVRRLDLENELRRGIDEEQFFVVYQPIIAIEDGALRGFEALVRWDHPERGLIAPDEFLNLAEETGDIIDLGAFVFRRSCEQLAAWRRTLDADGLFMSVNLSRRQLAHPSLLETLTGIVEDVGIDPGSIKLEITEHSVMDGRADMIPTMESLREHGFPLAIDDFGTGHSSLSCLHTFPVNVLKIDRAFTVNMEERLEFSAVMHAILSLAHHLGLQVIVEGVETEAQIAQLQAMNCELVQGYFFSRPLRDEDATAFIKEWSGSAVEPSTLVG